MAMAARRAVHASPLAVTRGGEGRAATSGHNHHRHYQESPRVAAEARETRVSVAEASRYVAAVTDAQERVRLVAALAPHLDERAKVMLSDADVHTLLVGHHALEERHARLREDRVGLLGVANRSKLVENKAQLREVTEAIQQCARDLREGLQSRAAVTGVTGAPAGGSDADPARVRRDRDRLQAVLQQTAGELEAGSYSELRRRVLTLTETRSRLEEKDRSAKELAQAIARLDARLVGEWNAYDGQVREKDATILALREELRRLREGTVVRRKYKVDTAESRIGCAAAEWNARLDALRGEVARLEARAELDTRVNDTTSAHLRRMQDEAADELRRWEERYATDYPELVRQLEELTAARDHGAQVLAKLRARWEDDERKKREAEERAGEERRTAAREKRWAFVAYVAQARIRFYWRVYKRRRAEAKGKKKGGAGKKKKKGGAGKKKKKK